MFYSFDVLRKKGGRFSTVWKCTTKPKWIVPRHILLEINVSELCDELTRSIPSLQGKSSVEVRTKYSLYLLAELVYGTTLLHSKKCHLLLHDAMQLRKVVVNRSYITQEKPQTELSESQEVWPKRLERQRKRSGFLTSNMFTIVPEKIDMDIANDSEIDDMLRNIMLMNDNDILSHPLSELLPDTYDDRVSQFSIQDDLEPPSQAILEELKMRFPEKRRMDVGDFGDVIADASTLVEKLPEDQSNFFRGMDVVSEDLSNIRRSSPGLASRSKLKDISNTTFKENQEKLLENAVLSPPGRKKRQRSRQNVVKRKRKAPIDSTISIPEEEYGLYQPEKRASHRKIKKTFSEEFRGVLFSPLTMASGSEGIFHRVLQCDHRITDESVAGRYRNLEDAESIDEIEKKRRGSSYLSIKSKVDRDSRQTVLEESFTDGLLRPLNQSSIGIKYRNVNSSRVVYSRSLRVEELLSCISVGGEPKKEGAVHDVAAVHDASESFYVAKSPSLPCGVSTSDKLTELQRSLLRSILEKMPENDKEHLTFKELTRGYTRSQAAASFYQLLELLKKRSICAIQKENFGEIYIVPACDVSKSR